MARARWHALSWHGAERSLMARGGLARHGTARFGTEGVGTARHGFGTAQRSNGTAWHGTAIEMVFLLVCCGTDRPRGLVRGPQGTDLPKHILQY